ncbi:MAG TPA: imidazolonepropionase [Longimicrobiales bacterium]|nr:imidazolonepropionase [Longimicrobiales bacterium]
MSSPILLTGASEIVTESSILTNHAIALEGDRIAAVDTEQSLVDQFPNAERFDCARHVLTAGFVDSHTHAVFGGFRAAEYEMRARGLDYMEIARRGGGINASVQSVRALSESDLVELAIPRLADALHTGTTTIEIKSGYGLTLEDELKMLRAIARLREHTPIEIVATFLGAHDVPLEMRERRNDYVSLVANEMVPAVAHEKLATFCDVFMEPGAFIAAESRRILEAGVEHGLIPKLHADEFANSCAAELAAEMHAASADHLGAISEAGIAALSQSKTVATLLPATLFFLGKKTYAPARRLLDAGVVVALATDFNPGTAPSSSMPLVLTMACSQMQMTPFEALRAATWGGARALLLDDVGRLAPGACADVVAWNVASHLEIPYHFGKPPVAAVWKAGKRVI